MLPLKKLTRKEERKQKKQKKISNRANYYKSKQKGKQNSDKQNVKQNSDKQNLDTIKSEIKTQTKDVMTKIPKKKLYKIKSINKSKGGLQFHGENDRMAQLQALVNRESKQMSQVTSPKVNKRDKSNNSNEENMTKSHNNGRIEQLKLDQLDEIKNINKMERKLQLIKHQRKPGKLSVGYKDEYEDILVDIETGKMDNISLYESDSEDDLDKDFFNAIGKQNDEVDSDNRISTKTCNDEKYSSISFREENINDYNISNDYLTDNSNSFIVDDNVTEYKKRPNNNRQIISDSESDASPIKLKNRKIVAEESESEENEVDEYFDNEAEEGNESETEVEYDVENFIFEGGSMQRDDNSSPVKSQGVFDLYTVDSSETECEDSEFDDFIVSDSDSLLHRSNSIIEKCLKISSDNMKKRKRIKSVDSSSSDDYDTQKSKKVKFDCNNDRQKNKTLKEDSNQETYNIQLVKNKKIKSEKSSLKSTAEINNKIEDKHESSFINGEEYSEDIYGRLRDKKGNIVNIKNNQQLYKTPAQYKLDMLNCNKQIDEKRLTTSKKLKGMMNRLTDSNMQGVANQVETMYNANSRNVMNEIMTSLLLDTLGKSEPIPNRLIQEHALLISILSANIGCEVGAHILTEFVIEWKEGFDHCQSMGNDEVISCNEWENLMAFVSYLFMFRVVDSCLIFDILNYLSQTLHLLQIQIILSILRNVGFTLRKSDPIALKKFISEVQAKSSHCASESYTRIQFLMEIFMALKNNNMSKIPEYDPRHGEHLKLIMKACLRKSCTPSDLKVTLNDLLKSKVVGRWWIVGSAWSDGLKEEISVEQSITAKPTESSSNLAYSEKFLKKAKLLHFMQPPRINIFYALTEASGDSVQILLQLKLAPTQIKEIFNVMLKMCLKGKEYNSFYDITAENLCSHDRKYKKNLKYALWDKFNELSDLKLRNISNLSKFTGWLICKDALNMAVFKNLTLNDPDSTTVTFLRQTLIIILMNPSGNYTIEKVFKFLCCSPKLMDIRKGIKYFMAKHMQVNIEDSDKKKLAIRTKIALDILDNTDIVL